MWLFFSLFLLQIAYLLLRLRVNRNFSKVLISLSGAIGRLELWFIESEQFISSIQLVIFLHSLFSSVAPLLKESLEYIKLESGLD